MNLSTDVMPVRFEPALEREEPSEATTIDELVKTFVGMARTVADTEGHAFRAVHAKGQGLLRGELTVFGGLPEIFAQGLFARPGVYAALMRLSAPPAEQLTDEVSTPRAVAIKVLGVPGDRLPEALGPDAQDFLMVNGPAFSRPDPRGFLKDVKMLAATTEKSPRGKEVLSAVLRGAEHALEAIGGESAKLKSLGGHPKVHPLGETYFSQTPYLFGPYVAKFSLQPLSPALTALDGAALETEGDDAQREAVAQFFAAQAEPVDWALRVQLCVNTDEMPIEDASVKWDEDMSPWVQVATLSLASQQSWQGEATQAEEDALAFSPWNGLAAHRPLGGVNRARKIVMAASREFRSTFNRCPIHDPVRVGGAA
ncbi:catalase family protein [Roseateles chitinivorans]|uniref:catalase family protein n=1 Tax=Roseateles chitinivorans TaxID=2917965 RepID=UPI003D66FAB8